MTVQTLLPVFAVALVGYSAYSRLSSKRKTQKTLPGPAPLPLVGNIFDVPQKGTPEFSHWLAHKDKYGPISAVNIFGQTMVIVHDREIVSDLLEKRSKSTSGRPHFEFSLNFAGYGKYITTHSYNDMFRKQRKYIHQQIGTMASAEKYNYIQRDAVPAMLTRILEDPDNLVEHFRT
jgi:fumagillin biosynthesis cytochrome P450 monooxygenase